MAMARATARARARATIKGIPTVSVRMADAIVAGERSDKKFKVQSSKTEEVSQFKSKEVSPPQGSSQFANSPTVNFFTLYFEL
jgi:hypothetical protein